VDSTVRLLHACGFDVFLLRDAHSTAAGTDLEAAQVVAHENATLERYATLIRSADLQAPV
jgi:nicotinamidase-related amidase